jgi:ribonuclease P protein component
MERRFRLTRSIEFKRVRNEGKSYAHPFVVLIVSTSQLNYPRIGVTASHNIGGAIQRNRAKRLLREAVRLFIPSLLPAHIILIARAPLARANLKETRQALEQLFNRANLISNQHEPTATIVP